MQPTGIYSAPRHTSQRLQPSTLFGIVFATAWLLICITLFSVDYFQSAQAKQTPYRESLSAEVTPETTPTSQPVHEAPQTPAPTAQATAPQAAAQPAVTPPPAAAYDTVTISSIGLASRFVPVGLTATNNIDVHPTLVGHWTGGAQFGSPGAVFLDGHNPGVFSGLPSIQKGATITITKASGETFTYTVVHTETVWLAGIDMRRATSTHNGAAEGLNIMTCVGAYNAQTGTTDQRFVVYAVRS
jgi:sortase (surface protein transpeptidase)